MKCPDDPLVIMLGGVMDEMFPECWPEYAARVLLMSGRKCPDDPVVIMLKGGMS
jgi:hypothetical protein